MAKPSGFRCPHCDNWISGMATQKTTGQIMDEAANHVMKKVLIFMCVVGFIILVISSS